MHKMAASVQIDLFEKFEFFLLLKTSHLQYLRPLT